MCALCILVKARLWYLICTSFLIFFVHLHSILCKFSTIVTQIDLMELFRTNLVSNIITKKNTFNANLSLFWCKLRCRFKVNSSWVLNKTKLTTCTGCVLFHLFGSHCNNNNNTHCTKLKHLSYACVVRLTLVLFSDFSSQIYLLSCCSPSPFSLGTMGRGGQISHAVGRAFCCSCCYIMRKDSGGGEIKF